jgi:voltage-gated potassium channel
MISRDTRGRASFGAWEYLIQALIILSLVSFAFETLPDLSDAWQSRLRAFEIFSVSVFTVEYLLRIALSRPPRSYAFSFFGIIDLLAILPFYLATGLDLRSLRAFRLLRLFRILKLARYSAAAQRYHRAFLIAREELILFGATALIALYLTAVGIYYFENSVQPDKFSSVFDSLWWAICTLTTVGYGDVYPITVGGRIFTFFVLVINPESSIKTIRSLVHTTNGGSKSALTTCHSELPPTTSSSPAE